MPNFGSSFFRKNIPLFWTIVARDHDRTLKESTEQVRNVLKVTLSPLKVLSHARGFLQQAYAVRNSSPSAPLHLQLIATCEETIGGHVFNQRIR